MSPKIFIGAPSLQTGTWCQKEVSKVKMDEPIDKTKLPDWIFLSLNGNTKAHDGDHNRKNQLTVRKAFLNLKKNYIENPALVPTNHFKVLFDFGYNLCLTSFKFDFQKDESNNGLLITVKTNIVRKILTGIIFILGMTGHAWNVADKFSCKNAPVINYFHAVHALIHSTMMVMFYRLFFINSGNCFKLLLELAQCRLFKCDSPAKAGKVWKKII